MRAAWTAFTSNLFSAPLDFPGSRFRAALKARETLAAALGRAVREYKAAFEGEREERGRRRWRGGRLLLGAAPNDDEHLREGEGRRRRPPRRGGAGRHVDRPACWPGERKGFLGSASELKQIASGVPVFFVFFNGLFHLSRLPPPLSPSPSPPVSLLTATRPPTLPTSSSSPSWHPTRCPRA